MANYNATTDVLQVSAVIIEHGDGTTTKVDSDFVGQLSVLIADHNSDSDNLTGLISRVSTLENSTPNYDSDLQAANSNYISIDANVKVIDSDLTVTRQKVLTAEGEIDALQTAVGTATLTTAAADVTQALNEIDAEIGTLSSLTTASTANLVSAINALQTAVTTLTTDLTNLQADVDNLASRTNAGTRGSILSNILALNDLSDVSTGTPTANQALVYDGAGFISGEAYTSAQFDAAFGAKSIGALADVSITGANDSDASVLVFNGATYVPGTN